MRSLLAVTLLAALTTAALYAGPTPPPAPPPDIAGEERWIYLDEFGVLIVADFAEGQITYSDTGEEAGSYAAAKPGVFVVWIMVGGEIHPYVAVWNGEQPPFAIWTLYKPSDYPSCNVPVGQIL